VTVGGGGDGLPLLRTSLEALQRLPDLAALVLTGPLQGAADRRSIEDAGQTLRSRVRCMPYVEDPRPLMAAADLVISMAGYNTVAELLSCNARMLLVPRDWRYGEHAKGTAAGVEKEQPLRAAKLAEAGLASVLEHARMTPDSLAAAICVALQRPRPDGGTFALDGATRAAAALCGMLGELADAA
jgi:predicted glycosyltransferase